MRNVSEYEKEGSSSVIYKDLKQAGIKRKSGLRNYTRAKRLIVQGQVLEKSSVYDRIIDKVTKYLGC